MTEVVETKSKEEQKKEENGDSDGDEAIEQLEKVVETLRRNEQHAEQIGRNSVSAKLVLDDVARIVRAVVVHSETEQRLMQKIQKWRETEQGMKLISQAEVFLDRIKNKPEFSDLRSDGLELLNHLRNTKDGDQKDQKTLDIPLLLRLCGHFQSLANRLDQDQEGHALLELAETTLKELQQSTKLQQKFLKTKTWLEKKISSDELLSKVFAPLLDQDGKLTTRISMKEITPLLKTGGHLLSSILSDAKSHGKDANSREIADEIQNWAEGLISDLAQDQNNNGRIGRLDKLAEQLSNSTLDPDAKGLIEKGNNAVQEFARTEKGREIVKEVVELEQREDVQELIQHAKQLAVELKENEDFQSLILENKQFLIDIKGIVVPFIVRQVLKMDIPIVEGKADSIIGMFSYTLSEMTFSGLDISPKDVDVTVIKASKTVTITISKFVAKLSHFKWKFKKEAFPKVKDSGTASASVGNGHCKLQCTVSLNNETRKPIFNITNIEFVIVELQVIAESGKASHLYNWLLKFFSDKIKIAVQHKICLNLRGHADNLAQKVNELASRFLPAFGKDSPPIQYPPTITQPITTTSSTTIPPSSSAPSTTN